MVFFYVTKLKEQSTSFSIKSCTKSCGTGSHVSKADFDLLQFHMCQQIKSLELDGGKKNGCACELELLLFTGGTIILFSNANWQPPTCFESTGC